MAKKRSNTKVEESTCNVFVDFGFPHADRERLEAKLMREIYRAIAGRGLAQVEAGKTWAFSNRMFPR